MSDATPTTEQATADWQATKAPHLALLAPRVPQQNPNNPGVTPHLSAKRAARLRALQPPIIRCVNCNKRIGAARTDSARVGVFCLTCWKHGYR